VPGQPLRFEAEDEPVSIGERLLHLLQEGFSIPRAPAAPTLARWIPPGQAVEIAGLLIPGGMLYVGGRLLDVQGQNDPCLIDPKEQVARAGDCHVANMGYWPRYAEISPAARRSYLEWLAGGRKDPRAYIGYVFLFFYGLERRVMRDFEEHVEARADRQAILGELTRLRDIYGHSSSSFYNYASELISWLTFVGADPAEVAKAPGVPRAMRGVPLRVRYAVGKLAAQGACLPTSLAAAWALSDPETPHGAAAHRCPEEFLQVFGTLYESEVGPQGLLLPAQGPALARTYTAASDGFGRSTVLKLPFRGVLDPSRFEPMRGTLRRLAMRAEVELAPYSSELLTGYRPAFAPKSLAAHFLLPRQYWPPAMHEEFKRFAMTVEQGPALLPARELMDKAGLDETAAFSAFTSLIRALARVGLGVEPDPAFGRSASGRDEPVVLFALPENASLEGAAQLYGPGMRRLQLYFLVATATGTCSARALAFLQQHVRSWTDLPPGHVERYLAYLILLAQGTKPVALAQLKRSLKVLPDADKVEQARVAISVAYADGDVAPAAFKLLENVYKAMGLDPKNVVSDVYAVSTGGRISAPAPSPAPGAAPAPFVLDTKRIAALQEDSAKAAALLTSIFVEEDSTPVATAAQPSGPPAALTPAEPGLLGLDSAHSHLVRKLLTQAAWSRAELFVLAAELGLMPEGALEHINEAAFEAHDIPFTEGDDPLEINPEILEKLKP